MKKIAVLQPFYMPWLGVFNQIASSDVFIFGDNFKYSKNSWINRNRIKNPNGGFIWLTVPVRHQHLTSKPISEVEIDYDHNWIAKHLNALRSVYGRSAFFEEHYCELEKILSSKPKYLFHLNIALFDYFLKILDITTVIKNRSAYENLPGDKSESLLSICQREGATAYLTGPRAQDYLNEEIFTLNKIEIEYQNFSHEPYRQRGADYVDRLSVIDALFMLGPKETRRLIYQNA